MRELKQQFKIKALKILDRNNSLELVTKDLENWSTNYRLMSEDRKNESPIKSGFEKYGYDVNTISDDEIKVLAQKLVDEKNNQIVDQFKNYPIEKIINMAESNHNEMSQAFLEIEYGVQLSKVMKHRIPQLNELRTRLGLVLTVTTKEPIPKVYKSFDLNGFETVVGSLQAGRIESMLEQKVRLNGEIKTRKEFLERFAASGEYESTSHGLKNTKDGLYYCVGNGKAFNASCIKYFDYLKSIGFKG